MSHAKNIYERLLVIGERLGREHRTAIIESAKAQAAFKAYCETEPDRLGVDIRGQEFERQQAYAIDREKKAGQAFTEFQADTAWFVKRHL